MKNKIIIFLVLASFSGFGQITRTLPNVTNTADSMKPVSTVQKAAIVQKLHTVATISALQGFTDATIATFDGSQWNKKSGNIASNGGAYAGTIINVSTLFYWERKTDYITPEMFGAVGDGTTDDIVALNLSAGATAIAKKNLLLTKKYAISDNILIKNGTQKVYGGGTVKSLGGTYGSGIFLMGKGEGQSENVTGCIIQDLTIDCNNQPSNVAGIRLSNVQNCIIENNTILNVASNYGILLQTLSNGIDICTNNIITKNKISCVVNLNTNATITEGIGVVSDFSIGSYTSTTLHWKATFAPATSSLKGKRNVVMNNFVEGGYYGIILSASDENTVSGNNLNNNIRNIMINNICLNNVISNNELLNSLSTNISIAYSSSNNIVKNNHVKNTICTGESIFQAYVNSKANIFQDNIIETTSAPEFMLYCAIHSDNNEFIRNKLIGDPSKAYIGVESAWKTTTTNYYHSRYNKDVSTNNFANTGMSGIKIIGNVIKGNSNSACQIELSQISDAGGNFSLSNITIQDNIFDMSSSYLNFLWEDNSSSLNNIQMSLNKYSYNATKAMFIFPRNRDHFNFIADNQKLDKTFYGEYFTGATPSISTATKFISANSSATTITNFLGGNDEQEIEVRLDIYTTIQNNGNIILKGGVNVTGNSNNFIRLKRSGGIWIESFRNF